MTIRSIFHLLIGDRNAILTIARTPHAIWIAILLVLSAGLSRNYDKEPLLHEPLHALGPLLASALIGTGLFLVLVVATRCSYTTGTPGHPETSFLRRFIIFMTLYWMTAPMAWLYGIPWERMASAATATELNLWTLALVSLWRVVLIGWIAAIIFGVPTYRTMIVTLTYSNIVAVGAIIAAPFPIINVMGGIELSESEAMITSIAGMLALLSTLTVPLLSLVSLSLLATKPGAWQVPTPGTASNDRSDHTAEVPVSPRIHPSVLGLSVGALLFWSAFLPWTQPAQSLRFTTEQALRTDIERGIDLIHMNGRSAYPVHWDPPPRRLYGETTPEVLDVLAHLTERPDTEEWVVQAYREKLMQSSRWDWRPEDSRRLLPIVARMTDGPRLAYEMRYHITESWYQTDDAEDLGPIGALGDIATDYARTNDLPLPERFELIPMNKGIEDADALEPVP